ncbi:hypothetical protein [Parasulfitobacter algicola]|uniref:Holin-X, holin superfamily III n=1 Tax=Parasulfitobacter algicola TaxID=2614809 RepID=A0ABX2IN80_9RHOB|nr:hypothetical protein [Sulfitobacter algicola]NSX54342.1 hypothetical protein [Sulfitobacter algicola]
MFEATKAKARRAAKRAAISVGATVLFLIGLAFLTVSIWVALNAIFPTEIAALIMAGGFCGLGLILFGVAAVIGEGAPEKIEAKQEADSAQLQNALIQSFMTGLAAGQNAKSQR